ncbi:MAG: hypothetical protein WCS42_10465 [Verrucomicrobiota bacterium]
MNNNDLLIKERSELDSMLLNPLSTILRRPEEFTEVKILEARTVVVHFSCRDRSDTIELFLTSETSNGKAVRASNDRLLTKARRRLNSLVTEPERFTDAKIPGTPAITIRFECKDGQDTIDLVLNTETGNCLCGSHKSKPPINDQAR